MAKVSVIVPVYNVQEYLRQCLDSILVQTFSDIEVIIVDDGSTDQSREICDEYAQKDNRITVIHKKNGGLSDARNAGLDVASSEYISFIDSDDWIHPLFFEKLLAQQERTDADIVACTIHFFSDDHKIDEVWPRIEQDYVYQRKEFIENFFPDVKRVIMPSVCNKIFKRSIFSSVRFPLGKKYEDAYVQLDIYNNAHKIVVMNTTLYEYRKRNGSITDTISDKSYLDQLEFSIRHFKYFVANGLNRQADYALAQVVKNYLIAFFAQKYNSSECKEEFRLYSKVYYRYFFRIMKNTQICRLQKIIIIISKIHPLFAVRICQTYFPECLPEFLKKE